MLSRTALRWSSLANVLVHCRSPSLPATSKRSLFASCILQLSMHSFPISSTWSWFRVTWTVALCPIALRLWLLAFSVVLILIEFRIEFQIRMRTDFGAKHSSSKFDPKICPSVTLCARSRSCGVLSSIWLSRLMTRSYRLEETRALVVALCSRIVLAFKLVMTFR